MTLKETLEAQIENNKVQMEQTKDEKLNRNCQRTIDIHEKLLKTLKNGTEKIS